MIVNWVLGTVFIPMPIILPDTIFYYAIAPLLTFPLILMVAFNWPLTRPNVYQVYLCISVWSWSFYQIAFMFSCGFYRVAHAYISCGTKDFFAMFYYTSALQTIALFGLQMKRVAALGGAGMFFVLSVITIIPFRSSWTRNLVNFVFYQAFLIYMHYQREKAARRMFTLRDELKSQFTATQKAQINERNAAESKRRLTSYVFHEVRVPLNTALLAVQNMAAAKESKWDDTTAAIDLNDQEIEFAALEGSLSMMSKVLNDVLDFNRMDSGRFESLSRPYAFHQVMKSIFIPLRLATDSRKLTLVTDLDHRIDEVARRAAYLALGEDPLSVDLLLKQNPSEYGVVAGDETRLRQVVTNLASNACKFTSAGGTILVTTRLVLPNECGDYSAGIQIPTPHVSANPFSPFNPHSSSFSPPLCSSPNPMQKGSTTTKRDSSPKPTQMDSVLGQTHTGQTSGMSTGQTSGTSNGNAQSTGASSGQASGTSTGQTSDTLEISRKDHNPKKFDVDGMETIIVRIEITDTGSGIHEKDATQNKLFSAFNQTEQGKLQGGKGTGLGLALVRQIVMSTGGRLGVKSKAGHGSTFWVELPLEVGKKVIDAQGPPPMPSAADHRAPDWTREGFISNDAGTHLTLMGSTMSVPRLRDLDSSSPSSRHSEAEGVLVPISPPPPPTARPKFTAPERPGSPSSASAPPRSPSATNTHSSSSWGLPRAQQHRPQHISIPPHTMSFGPHVSLTSGSVVHTGRPTRNTNHSTPRIFDLDVLVVDDDPLTRLLMTRLLTRLGCNVTIAENGKAALELLLGCTIDYHRLSPSMDSQSSEPYGFLDVMGPDGAPDVSKGRRFAVCFMDNQMPVMSGLKAVAKLREFGRDDLVVGVTGNALLTDQREYLDAGANQVLIKPVMEVSLREVLILADEKKKRNARLDPNQELEPPLLL